MYLLIDLAFAGAVALVLSLLLVPWASGRAAHVRGSSLAAFLFFFFVLFLSAWAGGLWLAPLGPPLWGSHWLSFVAVGLLVALVMAAATAPLSRRYSHMSEDAGGSAEAAETAFGLFFWLLVVVLLLAVVFGYVAT